MAVSGPPAWLSRTLGARYRRFPASGPGEPALRVTVVEHRAAGCPADRDDARRAMEAAPFVDGLPDYPLLVERSGSRLRITSLHVHGWVDLASGRGEATACTHDQGAVENFLRVGVARLLLPRGGFLLHACAVVTRHGEAVDARAQGERGVEARREAEGQPSVIVGFGPSGAGKSTLASLAGDRPVVSDDLVVLARDGAGRLVAVPSLFRDGGAPPKPEGYPVRALLRLEKGPFALARLDRRAAARELLAAMPYLTDDAESAAGALALADAAAGAPGCSVLTFPKDASVWERLEAAG